MTKINLLFNNILTWSRPWT